MEHFSLEVKSTLGKRINLSLESSSINPATVSFSLFKEGASVWLRDEEGRKVGIKIKRSELLRLTKALKEWENAPGEHIFYNNHDAAIQAKLILKEKGVPNVSLEEGGLFEKNVWKLSGPLGFTAYLEDGVSYP